MEELVQGWPPTNLGAINDETLPLEYDGATIHARAERETEAGIAIYTESWSWDLSAAAE